MKEDNFEGHPCVTDRKDGKLRIRVWRKGRLVILMVLNLHSN